MAQTIDAATRLAAAGFQPQIRSLKTSGDLSLEAPLFVVANRVPQKEGRAFFTKELDEALLSGKADAAVHSFKDLPFENVPGIAEPYFFSEATGADILLLRRNVRWSADGDGLVIGTSSLRRIHQLACSLPKAKTSVLRGNVVTRLNKLASADNGINAILIAGAGLNRLKQFSTVPPDYIRWLEPHSADHVANELQRFRTVMENNFDIIEFPETVFPTAPGQGVLAFQLSEAAAAKFSTLKKDVFQEHGTIAARTLIERDVMRALNTGCHAPLGVSALRVAETHSFAVTACFSRDSSPDPVRFADPVFLSRQTSRDTAAIVGEIRGLSEKVFWWGNAPTKPTPIPLTIVTAFETRQLKPALPQSADYAAVFIASAAIFDWLKNQTALLQKPLWCAGRDSAAKLQREFGLQANFVSDKMGFAAVIAVIRQQYTGKILWLGSLSGQMRARAAAKDLPNVDFLSIYDNQTLSAAQITALTPELSELKIAEQYIHALPSAAAAAAFAGYALSIPATHLRASCFGVSAVECLAKTPIVPYHISAAATIGEYLAELAGDIAVMQRQMQEIISKGESREE